MVVMVVMVAMVVIVVTIVMLLKKGFFYESYSCDKRRSWY